MSEHKKRLTDSEVERVWDEQLDEPEGFDRMVRIQRDHLQARKDVKRLRQALEASSGWTSEHGILCWCHDGPCFTLDGRAVVDSDCVDRNALLAEVPA